MTPAEFYAAQRAAAAASEAEAQAHTDTAPYAGVTAAEAMGYEAGTLLMQAITKWCESGAPIGGRVFVMGPAGTIAEITVTVRKADIAHTHPEGGSA